MTRSLVLHCHVFFLFKFVSPKDMMTMNSVHCHVIFLFKCCRSLKLGQRKAKLLVVLFFFILVTQALNIIKFFWFWSLKLDGCFICFLVLVNFFFFFFFVAFATLVNVNLKKNKGCWRRGASFN